MKQIGLVFALTLVVLPTAAQTLYSNGPINGNTDAFTINSGQIVSDSFEVSYGSTVTGLEFGVWLDSGDAMPGPCAHCLTGNTLSAEVSITSQENGGTSYFDQRVLFTPSNCVFNEYGYDICVETARFEGPDLNGGTYWLNLQNAEVASGNRVYWDENSGPSLASQNFIGSIPSESFTVLGEMTTCGRGGNCSQSQSQTVPEPGSIVLFGTGSFALLGLLRGLRCKPF
jgi:hypothetical protein